MRHNVSVVKKGETDPLGEPIDTKVKKEPVTLDSVLTYRMLDGKFVSRDDGQVWDEIDKRIRRGVFSACFDGTDERTLLEGGKVTFGEVRKHAEFATTHLAINVNVVPFWLTYSPKRYLQFRAYEPSGMGIAHVSSRQEGVECIELSIPRDSAHWEGLLYVDEAKDYVPVKFVELRDGVAACEYAIKYAANDRVGWAVSSWRTNMFDELGEVVETYSGKVHKASFNPTIDKNLLSLDFPAAAHVNVQEPKESD